MWRPGTPSFCWSWSQQRFAFIFRQESLIEYDREKMRVWGRWHLQILPNNCEDASDQPVSPSCACYLISYIFLINFTGMKVCGGGSHQPCTYNELSHQQCHPKVSLPGYQWNCKRENICFLAYYYLFVFNRKSFSCCSIFCGVLYWNIYNKCTNSMLS